MTVSESVPDFLSACPSIGPAWREYLEFWRGEQDRGAYNDVAVVAHHLVDRFEMGDLSEFPAAFALLERCLEEGDEEVRDLVTVGLLEDVQNIASHRTFGYGVFYDWLGPKSRAAWDELRASWEEVGEGKAAGLLVAPVREATALPVDPGEVQDSALRGIIETLYRKGPGPQ